ncbi:MAG: CoA transferase [Gammaproteobacteria bacterium]
MRIIEGSAFIAAPMCGMTLAQLGAEVIRFDHIRGGIDYKRWPVTKDNHSIYWADLNKGKKSFAVDLKSPEGQELVTELIAAKDNNDKKIGGIFSTNLPAKGWLAYESLSAHRKDLIQLIIAGDRHGGSALDYTINAKVGYPSMTGPIDDARPVNHVLPAWDNIAAYQAALSILAADRHRILTGDGQKIEMTLADTALATIGHLGFIGDRTINGTERQRYGNHLYGAFGRDFTTKDEQRVMIIALSANQWRGLLQATGLSEAMENLSAQLGLDLNHEGNRFIARDELADIIGAWVAQQTFSDLARAFDENRVCWGKYQTITELIDDDIDVSEDNPIFSRVEQPDIGEYLVPGQPMNFSAVEREPARPAPRLGEHTEEILAEILGKSSSEIGRLNDQKIIATNM